MLKEILHDENLKFEIETVEEEGPVPVEDSVENTITHPRFTSIDHLTPIPGHVAEVDCHEEWFLNGEKTSGCTTRWRI